MTHLVLLVCFLPLYTTNTVGKTVPRFLVTAATPAESEAAAVTETVVVAGVGGVDRPHHIMMRAHAIDDVAVPRIPIHDIPMITSLTVEARQNPAKTLITYINSIVPRHTLSCSWSCSFWGSAAQILRVDRSSPLILLLLLRLLLTKKQPYAMQKSANARQLVTMDQARL